MTQRILILFFAWYMINFSLMAQAQVGFTMPENQSKIQIPFTEVNNLIVIPVVINNFLRLNFILDTGVDTPILTEMAFAGILGIDFVRQITISGPGIQDSIRALVGHKVNIRLPGNIIGQNLNLLVLQDDYLELSAKMGMDVHGIIGYDLFRQFVVEINYDDKILTFHEPRKFRIPKNKTPFPLSIANNKPYISCLIENKGNRDTVTLLIDTGASHALLIDPETGNLPPPEKTISTRLGTGLGGDIPGKIGRMDQLELGKHKFSNIIAAFPNNDAYSQLIKRGSRHGTIGGDVLSKFNPIVNYDNKTLYLSRSKNYKTPYEIDMSGMILSTCGPFHDSLKVDYVRPLSPAEEAGIEPGDKVIHINNLYAGINNLADFNNLLRKKNGKKIRIRISRDGEKKRLTFKLKRQI